MARPTKARGTHRLEAAPTSEPALTKLAMRALLQLPQTTVPPPLNYCGPAPAHPGPHIPPQCSLRTGTKTCQFAQFVPLCVAEVTRR